MLSLDVFFQSLALFMPILAANQAGMVAKKLNLPLAHTPTSRRWLGENKTAAVWYVGPLLSMFVLFLYRNPHWVSEGIALGFGAVCGEVIKSFCKRLMGYPPGAKWFPDRIDFALGGAVAAKLCFEWVTFEHMLWLVAIAWPVHYFGNQFSYKRGWRKTPH